MRLALNPGGGSGGTCFGDSGGPDLLAGSSTVLAVNSYVTNSNCAGVGYSSRVDIPEVLAWINGFLPWPAGCAAPAALTDRAEQSRRSRTRLLRRSRLLAMSC